MTDRELMQQALEALDEMRYAYTSKGCHMADNAITALRERLAQPEQCRSDGRCQYAIDHGAEGLGHCPPGKCCMPAQPGPTAQEARNAASNLALMKRMFPQPEQPEFDSSLQSAAMTQTAAKLAQPEQWEQLYPDMGNPLDRMAENARELGLDYEPTGIAVRKVWWDGDTLRAEAIPPEQFYKQPEQEPVAWVWKDGTLTSDPDRADGTWTPLYTTPPRREWVGLTDKEIAEAGKLWVEGERMLPFAFASAIEDKLKEKNA